MLLTQGVNPLNYPQPQSMFHVRFPSANVNSKADEMQGRMFYGKERNKTPLIAANEQQEDDQASCEKEIITQMQLTEIQDEKLKIEEEEESIFTKRELVIKTPLL